MADTMNFEYVTILITYYTSITSLILFNQSCLSKTFYLMALLRNKNMSAFLDLIQLRFPIVISPVLENSLSEGTEVAGIVRNCLV